MQERQKRRSGSKRVYIICVIATVVILAALFGIYEYRLSQIAPVYKISVSGLEAESPAEAQAKCRAAYTKFADAMKGHKSCVWVWAGKKTVFLVKPSALKIDASAEETGFTAVKFADNKGRTRSGYIIDPTIAPVELGRVKISDGKDLTYANVSMTIREGIRDGKIKFDGAVYLWEKDTDTVLAVRPDTYTTVEGSIVSFTDDGNTTHTCFILDTAV